MSDSSIDTLAPTAPTISVVMPVYNGAKTIVETLDSIFGQTRQPDEVIVIDDGSQDNTFDVVTSYSSKIIVIKKKNGGTANARNLGIERASGDFIAVMDADDLWRADKLASQIEFCADADLIYTGVQNFGECDRVASRTFPDGVCVTGDHLGPLMLDNFIAHSSVLVRREAVLSVGGYDPIIRTAEDWDLWLRMAQAGMRFHGIPEPKTLYRWAADSHSKNHLQACKDRVLALDNAIERSSLKRIPKSLRKEAKKNVWRTSAWFAANDRPKDAILWYLRALRIQPTSVRTWKELVRTALNTIVATGR